METRYLNIQVCRLGEEASGGARCWVRPSAPAPDWSRTGKVLDLTAYRREREKWNRESAPQEATPDWEARGKSGTRLALALDAAATLAVVAASVGILMAFLGG